VRPLTFVGPLFLLLLLVVPLAALAAWWLGRRRATYTVAFTNFDVLASVVESKRRSWRPLVPLALFLLALAAASVAVARPVATVSEPSSNATVVLLVDVSGSMRASDVKPTRLQAAVQAMSTFADKVPKGVKIGLVSFSNGPDILVAPTTDRELLHEGIDLLEPESGTAIGDGLQVAVSVAKSAVGDVPRNKKGQLPAAIVLLSDGAQTRGSLTPLQGAQLARNAGIRVFTISLGTNHGTLNFPGGFFGGFGFGGGRSIAVRPDPATMAAIARTTGGKSFRAKTAAKVDNVYKELGSVVTHRKVHREIGSWFAGAAALLLLAAIAASRATAGRLP
jgi:Ca-activated chloride channel family protein